MGRVEPSQFQSPVLQAGLTKISREPGNRPLALGCDTQAGPSTGTGPGGKWDASFRKGKMVI